MILSLLILFYYFYIVNVSTLLHNFFPTTVGSRDRWVQGPHTVKIHGFESVLKVTWDTLCIYYSFENLALPIKYLKLYGLEVHFLFWNQKSCISRTCFIYLSILVVVIIVKQAYCKVFGYIKTKLKRQIKVKRMHDINSLFLNFVTSWFWMCRYSKFF